jgi:hypothetical protein
MALDMNKYISSILLIIGMIFAYLSCDNSTEPKESQGKIIGSVRDIRFPDESTVNHADLYLGDSLLTTTDENGDFTIPSLEAGSYQITCSSPSFLDTTELVLVNAGKTTTHTFYLTPKIGRVYGEFEDMTIYNEVLAADSSILGWSNQEIYNAGTGATLQSKTLGYEVPDRKIWLGDSLLALADNWGQYLFKIQFGTYQITATCEGYNSIDTVITVIPDERIYVNFFMYRQ